MEKKLFEVSGKIKQKGKEKKFQKIVKAINENMAAELTMCLFGSKNKVKRKNIFIEEIKEKKEEIK